MENNSNKRRVPFGFKEVLASEKNSLVKNVFNNVAPKYNLMNDIMSFGIHRYWKSVLLDMLNPTKSMSLVDIGGGTGDIASNFLKKGGQDVTVVDINQKMILNGIAQNHLHEYRDKINWVNADAEKLPLVSGCADACTTAFCIRNVTDTKLMLEEAYRILKPGGHFLCLEFSKISIPLLKTLYDKYAFTIIPLWGSIIAKDKYAYKYLVESIQRFPSQTDFCKQIENSGLELVSYQNLSGGIVSIHSAWRL